MGYLDFDDDRDKVHLKCIRTVLTRRGLKPDVSSDWEVHGPHQDMPYQVYVGIAIYKEPRIREVVCVAIYPRAVYEIDDYSDWYKAYPENRIPVL